MEGPISFSQLDFTEGFDDDARLESTDWIRTTPLNESMENPEEMGLPRVGASDDETYRIADGLSRARESFRIPRDGVYCPVCHRANTDIALLRKPCPTCQRPLLKFGWD